MKLGQLVKRVMVQSGEDLEDTEEYREIIIAYLNEGLQRMADKYQAEASAQMQAQAGRIDVSGIEQMVRVKRITHSESGREVRWEPEAGGIIRIAGAGNDVYSVVYTTQAKRLEADTDEPELPESAHGALTDYATWRFYGNGSIARQQRGQFYYQRFLEALDRLRPFGQKGTGHRNMHGLYECT